MSMKINSQHLIACQVKEFLYLEVKMVMQKFGVFKKISLEKSSFQKQ